MATAAEAATEGAAAPPAVSDAAPAITGQAGRESAAATGDGAPAPAKAGVSEVVRLAREKRVLERRVAELTAARPAPTVDKPVTKESIVADLKKRYEEDPEAFLEEVAGEDFVTLAGRLAKRTETAKEPGKVVEALQKEVRELKAKLDGDASTKAAAQAKATAQQHVAAVQKEIETAVDEAGEPRYPVLATLDQDALDEPVALTAYQAVERAFQKECCDKDGKIIEGRRWTEEQQTTRFHAAFAALEKHYGKLRTPKNPSTPKTDEPEPSPTISNNNSSGTADRPVRRASGTLTVQEALRQALKEQGLSQ